MELRNRIVASSTIASLAPPAIGQLRRSDPSRESPQEERHTIMAERSSSAPPIQPPSSILQKDGAYPHGHNDRNMQPNAGSAEKQIPPEKRHRTHLVRQIRLLYAFSGVGRHTQGACRRTSAKSSEDLPTPASLIRRFTSPFQEGPLNPIPHPAKQQKARRPTAKNLHFFPYDETRQECGLPYERVYHFRLCHQSCVRRCERRPHNHPIRT